MGTFFPDSRPRLRWRRRIPVQEMPTNVMAMEEPTGAKERNMVRVP